MLMSVIRSAHSKLPNVRCHHSKIPTKMLPLAFIRDLFVNVFWANQNFQSQRIANNCGRVAGQKQVSSERVAKYNYLYILLMFMFFSILLYKTRLIVGPAAGRVATRQRRSSYVVFFVCCLLVCYIVCECWENIFHGLGDTARKLHTCRNQVADFDKSLGYNLPLRTFSI